MEDIDPAWLPDTAFRAVGGRRVLVREDAAPADDDPVVQPGHHWAELFESPKACPANCCRSSPTCRTAMCCTAARR
ncbi:hypothetical protein RKD33_005918 [Streptomyces sp. SAI-129]